MPTYRYRCDKCGDEFEVWQSITDPALTTHDADGGELRKVLSAAGIVLKGSGFYKTDSRNGSGGGKDSGDSGDSTKSETKTACSHRRARSRCGSGR
jgi:putative FmdB family regulatory protein